MARMLFEIPDDKLIELITLAEKLELVDAADVLNHSFSLFRWAVQQAEKGGAICSEQGKELEYVNIPCLVELQKKAKPKPVEAPAKGSHLKVVK